MEYTITPSNDNTYIILKVKGNITRQSATQMNLEAHALGRKMHISKYLVDVTEARNVDLNTETYQFAYTDMRKMEGMDLHARVATLVSPEDHSHEFMATVANNAGLDVNLFTNAEEAIHFLTSGPIPGQPTPKDE